ncbi:LysE family translocator [Bacillus salipaludis]|uniref:LysE family translocator n=1 Tax=Bacillus salipaludis TaxID=2547811 RepID=UPI002E20ACF2|nr:LysE family translocator [Bacillus salipaludis]
MIHNFYLFIIMCIVLIILPGPDTAITTKNTLTIGKVGGLRTVYGTCCALMIHTTAAVVGLSAIIVKSAMVFSIFKFVGALYLFYLGVKTLWSLKNKKTNEIIPKNTYQGHSCFKQGFLTNLLNPKVAVFFLTFLPQFVDGSSQTFLPFLLMGITYTVLTVIWFLFYISLINQISAFIKKPSVNKVMEGVTGLVLIVFGLKLALEKAN